MSDALQTHPTTHAEAPPPRHEDRPRRPSARRRKRSRSSLLAHGTPMMWLTGGMLALAVAMIVALLGFVFTQGFSTFWPQPIVQIRTLDGKIYMGQVWETDSYRPEEYVFKMMDPAYRDKARAVVDANGGVSVRREINTANFELTQTHFNWVEDFMVAEQTEPQWAVLLERIGGRFYGFPKAFLLDGKQVAEGPDAAWEQYGKYHDEVRERAEQRRSIEKDDIGYVNRRLEDARLAVKDAQIRHGENSPQYAAAMETLAEETAWGNGEFKRLTDRIEKLKAENDRYVLLMETAQGQEEKIRVADIVRGYPANQLGTGGKLSIYASRWWEYLSAEPREANSEGGVWPAILGTIVMTLLMSLAVVPFGVLAALYLREYAKGGIIVSIIRISINNLAGVPSIVYGIFGLIFFCYIVGGWIDGGPEHVFQYALPTGRWFLGLGLMAGGSLLGGLLWLANLPKRGETSSHKRALRIVGGVLLASAGVGMVGLLATTPFFGGFNQAELASGQPRFGKPALIWASFTLALLTLPVVIVATEEALSAVPNSMREGSYACGASKWQTIKRIVLPRAMPGIMTGMILAMARGAGEVAPLMLVGALKFTQKLPLDAYYPFLHADRAFMHLGFHILDVGFQSQNSEAGKPMVYTTTLLLITIVVVLNVLAIAIRSRLRKRFVSGQF